MSCLDSAIDNSCIDKESFWNFFLKQNSYKVLSLIAAIFVLLVIWPIGSANKELSCGHVGSCFEGSDCCVVSDSLCGSSSSPGCFCSVEDSSSWYCEGEPKEALTLGYMLVVIFAWCWLLIGGIWLCCVGCGDYKHRWTPPRKSQATSTPESSTIAAAEEPKVEGGSPTTQESEASATKPATSSSTTQDQKQSGAVKVPTAKPITEASTKTGSTQPSYENDMDV